MHFPSINLLFKDAIDIFNGIIVGTLFVGHSFTQLTKSAEGGVINKLRETEASKRISQLIPVFVNTDGAHHVLRELEREGLLNNKSLEGFEALEGTAPADSVPFAAAEALQSLTSS